MNILRQLQCFQVLCIVFLWQVQGSKVTSRSQLQILDSLLTNYDRRATPTNHFNNATTVTCELYIRSFGSIDPSSMDYQVDLYLRQTWHDERLRHMELNQPLDLNDPELVKAIWKPEVYFPNAKDAEFQFVTVPNVLVRINPEGEILYMLRLKLLFSCMMELSKFPLDTQVCTMEIASFSKTVKELVLQWKQTPKPIKMYRFLRMPQFRMEKIVATTCQEAFQIGNYSCLVAEFYLHRAVGFYLVKSYLPTILVVAISWVSFWMDVDSVPGRTTLGITTLLTVSTESSGIQSDLPQVSYVKAIDVWMGACTAFVFCALLEFTLVNYLWRRNCPINSSDEILKSMCRDGRKSRCCEPRRCTSDKTDKQNIPERYLYSKKNLTHQNIGGVESYDSEGVNIHRRKVGKKVGEDEKEQKQEVATESLKSEKDNSCIIFSNVSDGCFNSDTKVRWTENSSSPNKRCGSSNLIGNKESQADNVCLITEASAVNKSGHLFSGGLSRARKGILRNYTVQDFGTVKTVIVSQDLDRKGNLKTIRSSCSNPEGMTFLLSDFNKTEKDTEANGTWIDLNDSKPTQKNNHENADCDPKNRSIERDCPALDDSDNDEASELLQDTSVSFRIGSLPDERYHAREVEKKPIKCWNSKDCARKIDKYSRGIFPMLFGIFNIFYWTYYS